MRMIIIRAIILPLLLVAHGLAWGGFDEGLAAAQRDDYDAALLEWQPLAEQGNAEVQFVLGSIYDNGRGGIPQDFNKAMHWYRQAALQNHSSAQYNLGVMYDYGEGVPEDDAQAYMWFSVAFANGSGQFLIRILDELAQYMTPAQVAEGHRLTKEWLDKHPPTPPPDPSCIPY